MGNIPLFVNRLKSCYSSSLCGCQNDGSVIHLGVWGTGYTNIRYIVHLGVCYPIH